MGSGSVSDLGPQLFPDREDSTNVGPDVPMSTAPGNPRPEPIKTKSLEVVM